MKNLKSILFLSYTAQLLSEASSRAGLSPWWAQFSFYFFCFGISNNIDKLFTHKNTCNFASTDLYLLSYKASEILYKLDLEIENSRFVFSSGSGKLYLKSFLLAIIYIGLLTDLLGWGYTEIHFRSCRRFYYHFYEKNIVFACSDSKLIKTNQEIETKSAEPIQARNALFEYWTWHLGNLSNRGPVSSQRILSLHFQTVLLWIIQGTK